MRRLAWGLLATFGLTLLVGCGTGSDTQATAADTGGPDRPDVADTALVSASRDTAPDQLAPRATQFRILLTAPEGVSSPGLDATVSALLGRPDLGLTVVAPAADATGTTDERSAGALAPVPAETMTGHPASAVNGTMADTLELALAGASTADLVVIGATADPESVVAAETARSHGLPVLVVVVEPDPDLAAAGMLLLDVLDFQLDELVGSEHVHVLDVTACVGGVDGPSMVTADAEPVDSCRAQAIP